MDPIMVEGCVYEYALGLGAVWAYRMGDERLSVLGRTGRVCIPLGRRRLDAADVADLGIEGQRLGVTERAEGLLPYVRLGMSYLTEEGNDE